MKLFFISLYDFWNLFIYFLKNLLNFIVYFNMHISLKKIKIGKLINVGKWRHLNKFVVGQVVLSYIIFLWTSKNLKHNFFLTWWVFRLLECLFINQFKFTFGNGGWQQMISFPINKWFETNKLNASYFSVFFVYV
jgi:hypothetical protein